MNYSVLKVCNIKVCMRYDVDSFCICTGLDEQTVQLSANSVRQIMFSSDSENERSDSDQRDHEDCPNSDQDEAFLGATDKDKPMQAELKQISTTSAQTALLDSKISQVKTGLHGQTRQARSHQSGNSKRSLGTTDKDNSIHAEPKQISNTSAQADPLDSEIFQVKTGLHGQTEQDRSQPKQPVSNKNYSHLSGGNSSLIKSNREKDITAQLGQVKHELFGLPKNPNTSNPALSSHVSREKVGSQDKTSQDFSSSKI